MSAAALPPVWLLDVDGVVNACTRNPDRSVWPADAWVRTEAKGVGHRWPILVAQPVVDFIRRIHEEGRAEIRWHTTWQHDAQNLAKVLGLPEFPVQDAPEYSAWFGVRDRRDDWWKLPAAERVVGVEGRALVWTDDDLRFPTPAEGRAIDALRQAGRVLMISPNDRTGLTPKHLRQIDEFLSIHAAAQAA